MLARKDAIRVKKRKVDLVVISDVHLGTFGCHAKELLLYLNSIKPKKLILIEKDEFLFNQLIKKYGNYKFIEANINDLSYCYLVL